MKRIEVEAEQYGLAEKQVEKYLARAADDAWCEVWFRTRDGLKLGYRAGNKLAVFPKQNAPKPKTQLPKPSSAPAPTKPIATNPYDGDI